jgi:hypothetical protein
MNSQGSQDNPIPIKTISGYLGLSDQLGFHDPMYVRPSLVMFNPFLMQRTRKIEIRVTSPIFCCKDLHIGFSLVLRATMRPINSLIGNSEPLRDSLGHPDA